MIKSRLIKETMELFPGDVLRSIGLELGTLKDILNFRLSCKHVNKSLNDFFLQEFKNKLRIWMFCQHNQTCMAMQILPNGVPDGLFYKYFIYTVSGVKPPKFYLPGESWTSSEYVEFVMEYENTLINEKLAPVVPKNLKKFKSGMKLPTETLWWSKMDSIEDNPLIDLTPEVTCTMKNGLFDGPFDLKKASNTLHIDFKNSKLHGNLLLHSDDVIIDATYFNGLPVSSHINEKGEESVSRYIDGKIVYEKKLIDGKKVKKTKYYF